MNLSTVEREEVATELKRFASDLNLTDDQKEKLHALLRKQEKRSQSTWNRTPTRPKPTSSARLLQIAMRFVNASSTS